MVSPDESYLPLCTSCKSYPSQAGQQVGSNYYYDKYTDASAGWVMVASILIFFMKAGFLFMEDAFVSEPSQRRRVIITVSYMYAVIESSSHAYIIWHSPVSDAGNDLQRP
jgi:hypothetical protein